MDFKQKLQLPTFSIGIAFCGVFLSSFIGVLTMILVENAKTLDDIQFLATLTYIGMTFGVLSSAYGLFQVYKLKKAIGNGASLASILMMVTFGAFLIGSLVSLCSPLGFSFRMIFDPHHFEGITIIAFFTFVIGSITWCIGTMKLNALNNAFKNVFFSGCAVAGATILLLIFLFGQIKPLNFYVMVLDVLLMIYCIIAWFKVDVNGNPRVKATTPKTVSVTPETAPVKSVASKSVETPATLKPSVAAKASAPAPAKAASKVADVTSAVTASPKKSRTLLIVILVALIVIIALLCFLLMKSDSKEEVAVVEDTEVVENNVQDETPKADIAANATEDSDIIAEGEYKFSGTIAGKDVVGEIYINRFGNVQGAYCYGSKFSDDNIMIQGSYDESTNEINVVESYNGTVSGEWIVKYMGCKFASGIMVNAKGNEYQVNLSLEPDDE